MAAETETTNEREDEKLPEVVITRSSTPGTEKGWALWQSVAGDWALLKCGCADGFEAGSPPSDGGKYEGEIVRKLCEPAVH